MSKYEFLEQLKNYLSGQLPDNVVLNHVAYYRSYIENEIKGGRREADVLSELGDARLLGKTIIDAGQAGGYANSAYESTQNPGTSDNGVSRQEKAASNKNSFLHKAKIILIIALIIAVLFFIIRFAVRLLIYILPVVVILAIISYFVKRR